MGARPVPLLPFTPTEHSGETPRIDLPSMPNGGVLEIIWEPGANQPCFRVKNPNSGREIGIRVFAAAELSGPRLAPA